MQSEEHISKMMSENSQKAQSGGASEKEKHKKVPKKNEEHVQKSVPIKREVRVIKKNRCSQLN